MDAQEDPGLVVDWIGGNCPVQAEGKIDGEEFYFRARGNRWTMSIGGPQILSYPSWHHEEPYGDTEFAAGWMSEEEALGFIRKAVQMWRDRRIEIPGPRI